MVINRFFLSVLFVLLFTAVSDVYAVDKGAVVVSDSTEVKIENKDTKKRRLFARKASRKGTSESVESVDSLKKQLTFDELKGIDKVKYLVDSLRSGGVSVDSLTIDSLARRYFTDTIVVKGGVLPKINADGSLSNARILDSLIYAEILDLGKKKKSKEDRVNIFKDSLSFSRMSTTAIVFPGYGQIHNRQYWKLPVLYGSVSGLVYAGARVGQQAKSYTNQFNLAVANGNQSEIDRLYGKSRDYKTASTLLYVGAGLTYMYFLADGAFNYKGKEDSKSRASYLAFMFPGAGQIYNKQYWKLPIVYGGFATFAYIINFNGRGYIRYNNAYEAVRDGLPDEFNGHFSLDVLKNSKDNFRRARDMAILYTFAFYMITVVDAYVSASFKQYDVSDDLSFRVAPTINYVNHANTPYRTSSGGGNYGLSLSITF